MMMQIEAEGKVGVEKGKHSRDGKMYFFRARVRRIVTRLGTLYLYIPKLRKGGNIPFFITERKRSRLALMILVQDGCSLSTKECSTRRKIPRRPLQSSR
jgi:transposase-like protein